MKLNLRSVLQALISPLLLAAGVACGSAAQPASTATATVQPDQTVTSASQSTATPTPKPRPNVIHVGYFPNVTHIQPNVGMATFQQELGDVKIDAKVFNAGPSEIEALFAGAIDIGYIGPSPAVNGYIQSGGKALRVIAGAASGGASFVVRADTGIASPKDLAGKRLASPQLGNTQDIALRSYLAQNGLKTVENGGTVTVQPIANPGILSLFLRKELDGAWVPEPWATRLVREAGGKIFLDERTIWPQGKFSTTIVIVRKEFLDQYPDVVKSWLKAHVEVTQWVQQHPAEARQALKESIAKLTNQTLDDAVLADSLGRTDIAYDPVETSIVTAAQRAYDLGFLKSQPNVQGMVDLTLLNQVLKELGQQPIR